MVEVVSRRTSEPKAVSRRFMLLHVEWRSCGSLVVIFGMKELKLLCKTKTVPLRRFMQIICQMWKKINLTKRETHLLHK